MSEQQATTEQHSMPLERSSAFFPINIFGAIMGYAGLTLGLKQAHDLLGISISVFYTFALLSTILFIVFSITYLIKLVKYPKSVISEFDHPVSLHFFPTFSISLLLLSLIYLDMAYDVARVMWILGATLQFFLLLFILNNWIHHEKWQITHMNPAWFIPVVGAIVVPLGAVHFVDMEVAWFFFSIGLVFWIILNSIVMYRLFFHPPMMKVLEPTLFILIAPPSVGFISYMTLNGMVGVDEFARILYYIALFLMIMLFTQVPRFIKVPFALSWWAYTFPLAAFSLASFMMFEQLHKVFFSYVASLTLAVLFALIVHLTFKTIMAIKNKKMCVPPQVPASPQASEK
ncbi:SLAC1 anion channel family protein [Thiomicrorhabdus sp.]|uniref:SLAC1 anion channel family protein n=1 Tax=Thiomicrorhabdus sp. TaxID=2039724 RepID=UPI002AA7B46E|nr:SLAC1 anion channel family protein [Thiomicrorhabdus sp.]